MDGKNVDACEITKKQDVARDAQGKWKRGVSGNPAGRTPGPATSVLRTLRAWCEAVGLPKLMEQAEAGDGDALRALIALGIPRQKPVSIPTALPGGPDGVLAALEAGEIAPDEAKTMMAVHLDRVRIREIEELEQRLAALERAVQEKGSER